MKKTYHLTPKIAPKALLTILIVLGAFNIAHAQIAAFVYADSSVIQGNMAPDESVVIGLSITENAGEDFSRGTTFKLTITPPIGYTCSINAGDIKFALDQNIDGISSISIDENIEFDVVVGLDGKSDTINLSNLTLSPDPEHDGEYGDSVVIECSNQSVTFTGGVTGKEYIKRLYFKTLVGSYASLDSDKDTLLFNYEETLDDITLSLWENQLEAFQVEDTTTPEKPLVFTVSAPEAYTFVASPKPTLKIYDKAGTTPRTLVGGATKIEQGASNSVWKVTIADADLKSDKLDQIKISGLSVTAPANTTTASIGTQFKIEQVDSLLTFYKDKGGDSDTLNLGNYRVPAVIGHDATSASVDYMSDIGPFTITIGEMLSDNFTGDDSNILEFILSAPSGFTFSEDMDLSSIASGDLSGGDLSYNGDLTEVSISYTVSSATNIDEIGISNISLTPEMDAGAYGIDLVLKESKGYMALKDSLSTITVLSVDMDVPVVSLISQSPDAASACGLNDLDLTFEITGYSTKPDKMVFTYDNETIGEVSNITGLENIIFSTKELMYNSSASNNWLSVTTYYGTNTVSTDFEIVNTATSEPDKIQLKEVTDIIFKGKVADGNVPSYFLYSDPENNIGYQFIVDFDNDTHSFSASNTAALVFEDGDYDFYPSNAGSGYTTITAYYKNANGCNSERDFELLVVPDLITVEDIFCYPPDEQDTTIKIAYITLDTIVEENYEIKYSYLKITDGSTVLNTLRADDASDSEGGFYTYDLDISRYYTESGESEMSVKFDVIVDITPYKLTEELVDSFNCLVYTNTTTNTVMFNMISSPLTPDPDWDYQYLSMDRDTMDVYIYHQLGYSSSDEDFYFEWDNDPETSSSFTMKVFEYKYVLDYTKTFNQSVGYEYSDIVTAETDGELLSFEDEYCPTNTAIELSSNYTIVSVSSKKGAAAYVGASDYWTYTPKIAWDVNSSATIDTVTLEYSDNNGCLASTMDSVEITESAISDTTRNLIDFDSIYCPFDEDVILSHNAPIRKDILGDGVWSSNNIYYYNPFNVYKAQGVVDVGLITVYDIVKFSYTLDDGCPWTKYYDVTINALPVIDTLYTQDLCFGDSTEFVQEITVNGEDNSIQTLYWDFDDGLDLSNLNDSIVDAVDEDNSHDGYTMGTYSQPWHLYKKAGKYSASLTATSVDGCETTEVLDVNIGTYPVLSIQESGYINGESTRFVNTTSVEDDDVDPIDSLWFDMGDGREFISTSVADFDHEYEDPEVYTVNLEVSTQNNCDVDTTFYVPNFPLISVTNSEAYSSEFDAEDYSTGWIPSHSYVQQQISTWKHDDALGDYAFSGASGNMWLVGYDSTVNEQSWLESPTFDLNDVDFPLLAINIFESCEPGRDGAVVQYTLDDGGNWYTLGNDEDGLNWYNVQGVATQPGIINESTDNNPDAYGWSSDAKAWSIGYYTLAGVKGEQVTEGALGVRFRIAYSSNSYINSSYKGFGVGSFGIFKRERIVLHEEIINREHDKALGETTNLDPLYEFVSHYDDEIASVCYFGTSTYGTDPLHDIFNRSDASIRIGEIPTKGSFWWMDGMVDDYSEENSVETYVDEMESRMLIPIAYDFENVEFRLEGNSTYISADLTKTSDYFDENYGENYAYVRFIVIQKEYVEVGGGESGEDITHRNCMVDMLPNGTGNVVYTIQPGEMEVGESLHLEEYWIPSVATAGQEFAVVMAVYNYEDMSKREVEAIKEVEITDEYIYQQTTGITNVGLTDVSYAYPNPVSEELFVSTSELGTEVNWSLKSINGQVVKSGQVLGQETFAISVNDLNSGVYILLLNGESSSVHYEKIIVERND